MSLTENKKIIITKVFNVINWFLAGVIICGFLGALFFHWCVYNESLYVFPKENISFKDTFIHEGDVDELIKRYNNSSSIDKRAISHESLHKALIREGIIEDDKWV